jgi:hypothetical protein
MSARAAVIAAADGVAGDGDPLRIELVGDAFASDPLGGGVAPLDRDRIAGFWERSYSTNTTPKPHAYRFGGSRKVDRMRRARCRARSR